VAQPICPLAGLDLNINASFCFEKFTEVTSTLTGVGQTAGKIKQSLEMKMQKKQI